jgi:hypothetical protein
MRQPPKINIIMILKKSKKNQIFWILEYKGMLEGLTEDLKKNKKTTKCLVNNNC